MCFFFCLKQCGQKVALIFVVLIWLL